MAKPSNPSGGFSRPGGGFSGGGFKPATRNSPLPRSEPASRQITHEMIAKRAYEIYASGQGGSQDENWARAERELRGW